MRLLKLAITVALAVCSKGYRSFLQDIPNSQVVPNPYRLQTFWKAVGHSTSDGGQFLDCFGIDFANHGYRWTVELCQKDSDADGLTNGQELGDPSCTWIAYRAADRNPNTSLPISHPGICEPVSSSYCKYINKGHRCPETINSTMSSSFLIQTDGNYSVKSSHPKIPEISYPDWRLRTNYHRPRPVVRHRFVPPDTDPRLPGFVQGQFNKLIKQKFRFIGDFRGTTSKVSAVSTSEYSKTSHHAPTTSAYIVSSDLHITPHSYVSITPQISTIKQRKINKIKHVPYMSGVQLNVRKHSNPRQSLLDEILAKASRVPASNTRKHKKVQKLLSNISSRKNPKTLVVEHNPTITWRTTHHFNVNSKINLPTKQIKLSNVRVSPSLPTSNTVNATTAISEFNAKYRTTFSKLKTETAYKTAKSRTIFDKDGKNPFTRKPRKFFHLIKNINQAKKLKNFNVKLIPELNTQNISTSGDNVSVTGPTTTTNQNKPEKEIDSFKVVTNMEDSNVKDNSLAFGRDKDKRTIVLIASVSGSLALLIFILVISTLAYLHRKRSHSMRMSPLLK